MKKKLTTKNMRQMLLGGNDAQLASMLDMELSRPQPRKKSARGKSKRKPMSRLAKSEAQLFGKRAKSQANNRKVREQHAKSLEDAKSRLERTLVRTDPSKGPGALADKPTKKNATYRNVLDDVFQSVRKIHEAKLQNLRVLRAGSINPLSARQKTIIRRWQTRVMQNRPDDVNVRSNQVFISSDTKSHPKAMDARIVALKTKNTRAKSNTRVTKSKVKSKKEKRKSTNASNVTVNVIQKPRKQKTCKNCKSLAFCKAAEYHKKDDGPCPDAHDQKSWYTLAKADPQFIPQSEEIANIKKCKKAREDHQEQCNNYCVNGKCECKKKCKKEKERHEREIQFIAKILQRVPKSKQKEAVVRNAEKPQNNEEKLLKFLKGLKEKGKMNKLQKDKLEKLEGQRLTPLEQKTMIVLQRKQDAGVQLTSHQRKTMESLKNATSKYV